MLVKEAIDDEHVHVPKENIGIEQTVHIWRSKKCDLYLGAQTNFR